MSMLDGPKLEAEARRQLLAVGVNVEEGSVSDFLKQGAKAAVGGDAGGSGGGDVAADGGSGGGFLARVAGWALRVIGLDLALRIGGGLGWAWAKVTGRGATGGAVGVTVTRQWIDTLLAVHGFEVFLTDRFNADPHPGNIVVMVSMQCDALGNCDRPGSGSGS